MLRYIRRQTFNKLVRFQPWTAFVYHLKNRVLSFNEWGFQDTTEHTSGQASSGYPSGASCSINCIYHPVNVLKNKVYFIKHEDNVSTFLAYFQWNTKIILSLFKDVKNSHRSYRKGTCMNKQNCRRSKLSALSLWVNLRNHGPELKQIYLSLY